MNLVDVSAAHEGFAGDALYRSIGMLGIHFDRDSLPDLLRSTVACQSFIFSAAPLGGTGTGSSSAMPRMFDLFATTSSSSVGGVVKLESMYVCMGYIYPFELCELQSGARTVMCGARCVGHEQRWGTK